MTHIYYKDTLKVFPAPFHPLIPTLFLEAGKMPCSSNEKAKPCIILVNLAGIYFLRPNKLQKGHKVSKFLSSFLITEIIYDESKRTINTQTDSVYIQCPHMDEAIVQLVSARKYLLSKFYERSPIKFSGFPTPPAIETLKYEGVRLLAHQYVCYCAQHNESPDERGILMLFKKLNTLHHSILGLDAYCRAPNHLNCLCGPIHLLDSINTLYFIGFAPYCACRIIHKSLRHQFMIRNFIIDSYKTLVPEQLRMKKLSPKSLISIVIQNCRLPEDQMIKLFIEFGEFAGEIQRLTLKNIELTENSWNELLHSMTSCRSFRTIEVFELEKIDITNINEIQLKEGISKICKHCRFIQRFSISMLTPVQTFSNIKPFLISPFLYQISIQGQNMTEPFPDTIKLPSLLISLDFSHCSFSYSSLKSLFLLLARTPNHSPISLNLSDIDVPSPQWNQFYQELSKISPPTYISDLDWSGNSIRSIFISTFVSFFFNLSPIKFLSIDRIFGTNNMDDFKKFINSIPKGKLKGLSIGGSTENNFCGGIPQLFDVISTLYPLNIVHLIGQKMKVNDISSLMKFLTDNSKSLWEIFIDDTSIQTAADFLNLYKRIFALSIPIMGRPEIDLERLFGPKNTIDQSTRDELDKFKEFIARLPDVPSKICRAYFFSRKDTQKGLEFKDYNVVIHKFPTVFFNSNDIDRYQIQYKMLKALPSLIPNMARNKAQIRSLSDLQATTLIDPYREPRYEDPNSNGGQNQSQPEIQRQQQQQQIQHQINGAQDAQYQQSINQQQPQEMYQQNVSQQQQQDSQYQQSYNQQQQHEIYQQNATQNYQYQQPQSQFQQNVSQDYQYQDNGFQQQQQQTQPNSTQDFQYQQSGSQDQYQVYGNQDFQYQQNYTGQDAQYQQQVYQNQDFQYMQQQQYGGQDGQYQQDYQYQDQYAPQGDQYMQQQQYGSQDGQFMQQYPDQNFQYNQQQQQQYGGQDGQYQQMYAAQNDQYMMYGNQQDFQYNQQQQYGNLPLEGQSNAMPNSSIDLMYSSDMPNQQFYQQDGTTNQNGMQPPNGTGNQF